MRDKIMLYWQWLQQVLDVSGDSIMAVMSGVFVMRIAMSAWGRPPLTPAEAAFYSSAIAAFSYSNVNKGPKV